MTNPMTERVSRALAKIDGYTGDEDPNYIGPNLPYMEVAWPPEARLWWRYERKARAAIAAMREPTREMINAGFRAIASEGHGARGGTGTTPDDTFRAMIDEALKP